MSSVAGGVMDGMRGGIRDMGTAQNYGSAASPTTRALSEPQHQAQRLAHQTAHRKDAIHLNNCYWQGSVLTAGGLMSKIVQLLRRVFLGQLCGPVHYFLQRNKCFGPLNAIDGLNPVVEHVAQMLGIAAHQAGKYAICTGSKVNTHHLRNVA